MMWKRIRWLAWIVVVLSLLLAACSGPATDDPASPDEIELTGTESSEDTPIEFEPESAESEESQDEQALIDQLRTAGAKVETAGEIEQPFFTPTGQVIRVNGSDVQVFSYDTLEDAKSEAALIAPDGTSVGTSIMMWMATPHFYRSGKDIVLFVGDDEDILALLKEVLGQQVAGGAQTEEPPGTEAALEYADFQEALSAGETAIEPTEETVDQPFFSIPGRIIRIDGQDVQLFIYASVDAAEEEAALVSPDGDSVGTSIMMWMATPHFYRLDNVIALYVGNDEAATAALHEVLGDQFAGG